MCEASCAAAKMGFRTLLITMDMNKIARCPVTLPLVVLLRADSQRN